jgi:CRISPR system Cascade subunit CasC
MKVELHILQNFAPSNLNRDDTGAPKDCELGGYRRARISSQCLKRAVRDTFQTHGMFTENELAVRTKRIAENVADELVSKHMRDRDKAIDLVAATLAGAGLKVKGADDDHKSEYLIFLPKRHLVQLAGLINKHWDTLVEFGGGKGDGNPAAEAKARSKKKEKAEKKSAFPKEVANDLIPILRDAAKTPDLALFGRMIADDPSWNVAAACQVAHAISTNRVAMDFDFYTAVDDLRPEDTAGSDMMGTVQFNSSCFYRYSVLDVDDLRRNLAADDALLRTTVGAYVRASVVAIPTGKQNSMAAHNPPSLVLAVLRQNGTAVSLANAFCKPVRPSGESDLVDTSIEALQAYLQRMGTMYGTRDLNAFYIADRDFTALSEPIRLEAKKDLEGLVAAVENKIPGGPQ